MTNLATYARIKGQRRARTFRVMIQEYSDHNPTIEWSKHKNNNNYMTQDIDRTRDKTLRKINLSIRLEHRLQEFMRCTGRNLEVGQELGQELGPGPRMLVVEGGPVHELLGQDLIRFLLEKSVKDKRLASGLLLETEACQGLRAHQTEIIRPLWKALKMSTDETQLFKDQTADSNIPANRISSKITRTSLCIHRNSSIITSLKRPPLINTIDTYQMEMWYQT